MSNCIETTAKKIVFFKRCAEPVKNSSATVGKPRKGDGPKKKDIFEIHEQILTLLNEEFQDLPNLKQKLSRMEWIKDNSDDYGERVTAEQEYKKTLYMVDLIESGYREAKYRKSATPLLQEYDAILNQPIKVDFMGNKSVDQQNRKQTIVMDYLSIAQNYVKVNQIMTQRNSMSCKDCSLALQRADDLLFSCPGCGYAIKHFASAASYQENNRINVAQRYVYDKRAHFGDSIKKFQSIQNTTISDQVYKDILDKIKSHEIPIKNLTKTHLYEFLKLTKHSDHYEDINLIYSEITGTPPYNIRHLEQRLFELFDEVDPVYERIKPEGRTNFLNGQFVLFKLLQKLHYPCREDDFYILKTREKMLEHDQMWKKICNELQWTYIPTV